MLIKSKAGLINLLMLCGMGFAADAFALCTTSVPHITLPVPVGALQRDTPPGTVLTELVTTVDLTCDPVGFPTDPLQRYWGVRVAASNIDYGVSNYHSNSRKIGYEGLSLFWNMTGATFSRFPLNDTVTVFRLLTAQTGSSSTENMVRILTDGTLAAGAYPGFTFGLDLYTENDATTSYGRMVTFTIPPFVVNAVSCAVTQPTIIVPMGNDIPTFRFKGVGSTTDEEPVRIDLDCDAETRVNIRLDGRAGSAPGVLNLNPETGVASGIGIQILKEGTPVTFNTPTFVGTTPAEGRYPVEYTARYYQTAAEVTGGKANATLQFTLTYQ